MTSDSIHQDDSPASNNAMISSHHYQQGPWQNTSPYNQSPYDNSPLNEYPPFSSYMSHGMPSETLSGMPTSISHSHIAHGGAMTHHQLPMLATSATWPSELTAHAQPGGYSVTSNTTAVASVSAVSSTKPAEKTRKTLTFEQKRDMCLYHENNPGKRQADIGDMFNVERSTVSKVLRNKDMYLKGELDNDLIGKRTNSKNPDFDRTLCNYIRRQKERGIIMSDDDIMIRAHKYARGSPNQRAVLDKLTVQWLTKFKRKYLGDTSGPMRRASEPNIPDKLSISARFYSISPSSPSTRASPPSISPSDDGARCRGDFSFTHRQWASQSETSLTDNATASFSSEIISPIGHFESSAVFPLDPEFEAEQKRNGSFRPMELEYASQANMDSADSELMTPRNIPSMCKQESPDADATPSILNGRISGKALKSSGKLKAPSSEDAQRAAVTLLNYLQNLGQFDSEYSTIMQLTKKLPIQPNQFSHADARSLARIAEGDAGLITAGGAHGN